MSTCRDGGVATMPNFEYLVGNLIWDKKFRKKFKNPKTRVKALTDLGVKPTKGMLAILDTLDYPAIMRIAKEMDPDVDISGN
jgi:hypothetical protein